MIVAWHPLELRVFLVLICYFFPYSFCEKNLRWAIAVGQALGKQRQIRYSTYSEGIPIPYGKKDKWVMRIWATHCLNNLWCQEEGAFNFAGSNTAEKRRHLTQEPKAQEEVGQLKKGTYIDCLLNLRHCARHLCM